MTLIASNKEYFQMITPTTPTLEAIEALALEMLQMERHWSSYSSSDIAAWILSRFVRREEHERVVEDYNDLQREHIDTTECFQLAMRERDRLRAELQGQRCDGSEKLVGPDIESGERWIIRCVGCPACTLAATPKGDARMKWVLTSTDTIRDGGSGSTVSCKDDSGTTAEATQASSGGDISDTPKSAAPVTSITPESMSLLEHHCSEADFATIGKLRDESYAAGYQAGRDDAVRLNVKQVSHVVELGSETLRAVVALAFALRGEELTPAHSIPCADALLTRLREKETR